jgi:predicted ester cyclase
LGIPPTGKQVAFSYVMIDQIGDGKIAGHRSVMDALALLHQLGGKIVAGTDDGRTRN